METLSCRATSFGKSSTCCGNSVDMLHVRSDELVLNPFVDIGHPVPTSSGNEMSRLGRFQAAKLLGGLLPPTSIVYTAFQLVNNLWPRISRKGRAAQRYFDRRLGPAGFYHLRGNYRTTL